MYRTFPPSQASAQADAQCDAPRVHAGRTVFRKLTDRSFFLDEIVLRIAQSLR